MPWLAARRAKSDNADGAEIIWMHFTGLGLICYATRGLCALLIINPASSLLTVPYNARRALGGKDENALWLVILIVALSETLSVREGAGAQE